MTNERDTPVPDTKPPTAIVVEHGDPLLDLESLPPGPAKNVAQRIEDLHVMAREDRADNRKWFDQFSRGQVQLADALAKLSLLVDTQIQGLCKSIDSVQSRLLKIDSNQKLLAVEIRSIRQEQLAQANEIEAIKEAISGLRREDEELWKKIQERDRNGNGGGGAGGG